MYRSTHDDLNNQNRQPDRECEVGNLVDKHIPARSSCVFLSGLTSRLGVQKKARLILQVKWKEQKKGYLDVGRTRTYAPEGN
jgi:hypothetical protein